MPIPTTVVDEQTGTTFVAVPCQHCDGDGCTFLTVAEVTALLAEVSRKIHESLDDTPPSAGHIVDALADMGRAS